jgi:chromosome segregation ATPase
MAMSNSGQRRRLGSLWVDETEDEIDGLRDQRAQLRRRLSELDIEGESIWEEQERRWRRLESKLAKLAKRSGSGVGLGLAANIENLVAEIGEAYEDLDGLLD